MNITPSLEEALAFAEDERYSVLPLSCEMMADRLTPIQALKILKNVSTHCYLLESVTERERWGRYTFLGYEPKMAVSCVDGAAEVDGVHYETDDPEALLRQILSAYRSPRLAHLPSFTGGLVGYFSYDYIAYSEPTLRQGVRDEEGFKDVDLMLFDQVIAFDHFRQKIILIANMRLADGAVGYNRAALALQQMRDLLVKGTPCQEEQGRLLGPVEPLFDQAAYCAMVEKAKRHIIEGDIFQIVLSNRLSAPFSGSLLNTYRMLRTLNPSPYMFYFSGTDVEVAGASPETLVKLEDGVLYTFPLAGTRPRGATEEEDKAFEQSLLKDEKELAEHNMLVDLGRNDLGKVSQFGSVEVTAFHTIERYSHVMPAGTLSGAPKIRACQLIAELENNKRGIYGGAIGYIDFAGNMDTCIAIRLAYKKNGRVFIRSGAGIVADSQPEKEYEECINKAAAVVKALQQAEEVAE